MNRTQRTCTSASPQTAGILQFFMTLGRFCCRPSSDTKTAPSTFAVAMIKRSFSPTPRGLYSSFSMPSRPFSRSASVTISAVTGRGCSPQSRRKSVHASDFCFTSSNATCETARLPSPNPLPSQSQSGGNRSLLYSCQDKIKEEASNVGNVSLQLLQIADFQVVEIRARLGKCDVVGAECVENSTNVASSENVLWLTMSVSLPSVRTPFRR